MRMRSLGIPDVMLIESHIIKDDRGFFFESFNQRDFSKAVGGDVRFVQDNHSQSIKGVLRGLHYQLPPMMQGKLVRVVQGEVFDVAVDIRKSSPTFGKWVGEILSDENHRQLWIPEGFAHGFVTLSETAEVLYKVSNYYAPECERSIIWNDTAIGISWPIESEPFLSNKDANATGLAESNNLL